MILDARSEAAEILLDAQAILEVRGRYVGTDEKFDGPLSLMSAVAVAQSERRLPSSASSWDRRISFNAQTLSTKALRVAAHLEHEAEPSYVSDVIFGDVTDEDDNEDVLGLIDHAIWLLQEERV